MPEGDSTNDALASDSQSDQLLFAFLRDRDEPCPSCGYNLRNLIAPRCPECGEVLRLRELPAEPRIAWPVAGLIGLSVGVGFNLLFLLYCLIQFGIIRGSFPDDIFEAVLPYVVLPLAVMTFGLVMWLRRWRAIRQVSLGARIGLVLFAWSLPLISIILFSINIR